jgi:hypothetical protein
MIASFLNLSFGVDFVASIYFQSAIEIVDASQFVEASPSGLPSA